MQQTRFEYVTSPYLLDSIGLDSIGLRGTKFDARNSVGRHSDKITIGIYWQSNTPRAGVVKEGVAKSKRVPRGPCDDCL